MANPFANIKDREETPRTGGIQSVEVKTPTGQTARVKIGSKSYENYLAEGASIVPESGKGTPVGVISSRDGQKAITKAQETEARLSPIQVDPNLQLKAGETPEQYSARVNQYQGTTEATARDTSTDYVTYINPETEQEQTLRGTAITADARRKLENQGFVVSDSSVSEQSVEKSYDQLKAEQELSYYESQIATFVGALTDSLVSDADLQSEYEAIRSNYDYRQKEMEQINQNRQRAITTLGIRTGARYTGGLGGVLGGIIAEEERQGAMRIAELEAQKMSALSDARKAARDFNMSLYTTLIGQAQKAADNKYEEVKNLREAQQKQTEAIATRARLSNIGLVASAAIDAGVTDRNRIYSMLNNEYSDLTGGVTAEEFDDAMDALAPQGSGIIGEYEYYKREAQAQGQIPMSFQEYADYDANRKRPVTVTGGSGINPKDLAVIEGMTDKFDSAPITKQFNEVLNKKVSVDSIIANGVGGPADLALVFEFMKALDPSSVVRESEYESASKSGNIFAGVAAKFNGYLKPEGGILPEAVQAEFQNLVNQKYTVAERQYDNLRNQVAEQINRRTGRSDGDEWLIDYKLDVAGEAVAQESSAEQLVVDFSVNNPDKAEQISQLISETQPELGRPMTYTEVAEYLGIQV